MACVNLVTRAKMLYGVGMRRHRKSITTSPETIEAIVERTKLTLDLQIKLAHWLVEQEDRQNKFQFSVIATVCRIEAKLTQLLIGQLSRRLERAHKYGEDDLRKAAQKTESFISEYALGSSQQIVRYIHTSNPPPEKRRDRRKKWHGWEI